jgi:hypothetical protein
MAQALEPALIRDLTEATGALARHGVVIIRAIETYLEPALMAAAKSSMAASSEKLSKMDDDELDKFTGKLRKVSLKSAEDLRELYVRLMGRLGTEYIADLSKELEGIGQLFTWERIAKTTEPVNDKLVEMGFPPIELEGPAALSESFELEFEKRWPPAFERFKSLVDEAVRQLEERKEAEGAPPAKKPSKKRKSKE